MQVGEIKKRFLRLGWRDWGLLGSSAILLLLIRFALLCAPYHMIRRRFLDMFQDQNGRAIGRETQGRRILWAVETASRHIPKMGHCLTKAMTAKFLLNRQGYGVDLKIGVCRSRQGRFEAHAWLESEGRVVMGYLTDLNYFIAFPDLKLD